MNQLYFRLPATVVSTDSMRVRVNVRAELVGWSVGWLDDLDVLLGGIAWGDRLGVDGRERAWPRNCSTALT